MFNCMKYRLFNIILVWLLGMAAICSCSVMDMENIEEGTVVISGCISEAGGRKVLEGVKVHFSAYTAESESGIPVEEQSVYTDGKGSTRSLHPASHLQPHVPSLQKLMATRERQKRSW